MSFKSRKRVRCIAMLLGIATAPCFLTAQEAASPTTQQAGSLQSLLQRLGEQATLLQHSLPSLTCMESVISQEFRHKLVARSVDFTASMRAVRSSDGDIRESYEFKTLRGQPFSGGFVMPIYVAGGFTRSLRYFMPDQQPCYQYKLNGNRLDFETAANLPEGCRTRGIKGFALLDDTGNITHLERRVADRSSVEYHLVPLAVLDFTPLALNGVTYLMTRHLYAEEPNGGSIDRFEAEYSDCKLFSATVTIGPAVEAPQTPTPDAPATPK
jgi:hypothetical protein